MNNSENIYKVSEYLPSGVKIRYFNIEDWCKATHRCVLEIDWVVQETHLNGETKIIIQTGGQTYEVGPFYEAGDHYIDVGPIKCENAIRLEVQGSNDLSMKCKFVMIE